MRIIKFRRVFKNRLTGEISFAYWGFIDIEDKPVHDFSIFKSPAHNNQCDIISDDQFTGLFDKDGKEIYEGDKVEYENGNAGYGRPRDQEISVDIIPELNDHLTYLDMFFFWASGKVIGNIHDK